jgi:hypothetical protein
MPPAVDQFDEHPYLTQDELHEFCAQHQIAVEAWSPLAHRHAARRPDDRRHRPAVWQDAGSGRPPLAHRARRRRVSQVRHACADQGEHRHLDSELAGEDVQAISALNRNQRTGGDPDKFGWILRWADPAARTFISS